jgi:ABC-type branched-subunit amino acid transport system substrate-binding protein
MKNLRTKAVAGIIVTLFLTTMFLSAVPVKSANIGTLKIGVIGPVGLPHWSPAGMKEAAEMARDEINAMGGIQFPSGEVDIALEFANEWALPVPDPDAAKAETLRLIAAGCHVIMGGFRTEVTTAIVETCMDYQVPFIINGASTTELISQTVAVNYPRYKYLFRINPINTSVLLSTIFGYAQFQAACKLFNIYADPAYNRPGVPKQIPYAVLTEDLAWTSEIHIALSDPTKYPAYMGLLYNCTYAARIPETITDLTPYLTDPGLQKARLVIHIFSGRAGLPCTIQFSELGVKATLLGINVLAQIQEHWDNTLAKCEGETVLSTTGTRTPITPEAVVFWDNFVAKTGKWPIYTAWGGYDGIFGLKDFVENNGTITWVEFQDSDKFVAGYETSAERQGITGTFKFTSTHDAYSPVSLPYLPTNYVRARVVQWQEDPANPGEGIMETVGPIIETYSQKWKLPGWIYPSGYESLAESDTCAPPSPAYNFTIDATIQYNDINWVIGAGAWLKKAGEAGWNYNADLNDDDFINVVDAVRVAKDFGKTVPGGYPI